MCAVYICIVWNISRTIQAQVNMGMLCWKSQLFLIDENTLVFIQSYTVTHNEMKSAKYQTFLHPKQRQVPYVHKILFSLVNVYEENEWMISKKNPCVILFSDNRHIFPLRFFLFIYLFSLQVCWHMKVSTMPLIDMSLLCLGA